MNTINANTRTAATATPRLAAACIALVACSVLFAGHAEAAIARKASPQAVAGKAAPSVGKAPVSFQMRPGVCRRWC